MGRPVKKFRNNVRRDLNIFLFLLLNNSTDSRKSRANCSADVGDPPHLDFSASHHFVVGRHPITTACLKLSPFRGLAKFVPTSTASGQTLPHQIENFEHNCSVVPHSTIAPDEKLATKSHLSRLFRIKRKPRHLQISNRMDSKVRAA